LGWHVRSSNETLIEDDAHAFKEICSGLFSDDVGPFKIFIVTFNPMVAFANSRCAVSTTSLAIGIWFTPPGMASAWQYARPKVGYGAENTVKSF
jgi:hypothetical protein